MSVTVRIKILLFMFLKKLAVNLYLWQKRIGKRSPKNRAIHRLWVNGSDDTVKILSPHKSFKLSMLTVRLSIKKTFRFSN